MDMIPHEVSAPTKRTRIERYQQQAKGRKGALAYVDKYSLRIDNEHYQRKPVVAKVNEIANDWSWIACASISVARRRDGSLWVMDGQYRVLAAMKRSDIGDLPCVIHDVVDIADEAAGFTEINSNRKAMEAAVRLKAMITAQEPVGLLIDSLLRSTGRTTDNKKKRSVRCIWALMDAARSNADVVKHIWPLLDAVVGDKTMVLQFFKAFLWIEQHMPDGQSVVDAKIGRRFVEIGYDELLKAAQEAAGYFGKTGGRVWASGMIKRYNHRLTSRLVLVEDEATTRRS
jgi:hypothetical protein